MSREWLPQRGDIIRGADGCLCAADCSAGCSDGVFHARPHTESSL